MRNKALTCLIDTIWGCLRVHDDSRALAALRSTLLDGVEMQSAILTTGHRADAADAAFVNAIACASTDRSDTHVATATHPGIIVIPALLAALSRSGGSGADLLRGIVVGYEVMSRIARAIMSPELASVFRPTAIAAPVAAAVAVATGLRLDSNAIVAAGALAAQTAIGFNEWARAGTGEHAFHAGFAARNAVTCAFVAARGAQAAPSALDGASGLLAGYRVRHRAPELTRALGEEYEMHGIVFKPAPACFFAQTPAQLAESVVQELPDIAEIAKIEIGVTAAAAAYPGCAETSGFASEQSAVMSIPFAVAATLRARRLDISAWSDFGNADIAALATRCKVVVDEALSSAYPERNGARLRVTMTNGAIVETRQEDFRSMNRDAVVTRFRLDAESRIGSRAAEHTLAILAGFEQLKDVRVIGEACIPQALSLQTATRFAR